MNLIPRTGIYQTEKSKMLKSSSGEDYHGLSDIFVGGLVFFGGGGFLGTVWFGVRIFFFFFKRWFFEDHMLPHLGFGGGKDTL